LLPFRDAEDAGAGCSKGSSLAFIPGPRGRQREAPQTLIRDQAGLQSETFRDEGQKHLVPARHVLRTSGVMA
jgi:hypothetical protein